MGRNNRDYKIKDKNLTKNKKNAKLNKSIAFTLAGMAAIGAGAAIGGQNQDAQAMMGRVGSMANKTVKGTMTKMPMTSGKISSPGLGVGTSRVLGGSKHAINSGKMGSNGTLFAGLPKTSTSSISTSNKNTAPTTPKTQTSNLTTTTSTSSSTGSLTSTPGSNKGTPKLSNVGSLGDKTKPFQGGNANSLTLKDGGHKQQAYNQQKNTGGPTFTTEGFYRK